MICLFSFLSSSLDPSSSPLICLKSFCRVLSMVFGFVVYSQIYLISEEIRVQRASVGKLVSMQRTDPNPSCGSSNVQDGEYWFSREVKLQTGLG